MSVDCVVKPQGTYLGLYMHKVLNGLLLALFILPSPLLALSLEGNLEQGGLMIGHTTKGAMVASDGAKVTVSPDGVFLVGFGRDHPAISRLKVTYTDGRQVLKELKIKQREYRIQRIDGLPKRKVTPQKMDYDRIKKESAKIRKARRMNDGRTDYLSGWRWPVEGPISGVYGSQRILNGKPRRPHFGVDIAVPTGTLVRAPADGIVTLAESDLFFSGGTLIVDHGQKLSSSFLHLSKVLVEVGTRVKAGDPIAKVGATGRVTGAHLDWRMNFHKHQIDPQMLVPPMPKQSTTRSAE